MFESLPVAWEGPRLELDALLEQLVQRAQEEIGIRGRLRGLLRANQMIISGQETPAVLRRIVDAARELVGARYAALGVIAADGHLAGFVHTGMPADIVSAIGDLPQGKGLLGALIDDPDPIRLDVLGQDPRSSGLPPGHPPMDSFLGVPIRVRDEVFGNLYLAEAERGRFTEEDEQLLTALAASAGMVIENARLLDAAHARQRWLRGLAAVTARLLSPEVDGTDRALELIAEQCCELAGADLVVVALPVHGNTADGPGGPDRRESDVRELRVQTATGCDGLAHLVGRTLPLAGSLSGQAFRTGRPLRRIAAESAGGCALSDAGWLEIGPVLAVPLQGSQGCHGVLSLARPRDGVAFSADDLDMAAGFANQAAVALELAEARAEQQRAVMLDERDRIAADLHDHVIQRLFATGLSLQSLTTRMAAGADRDRAQAAIHDLDSTISQIRTSIFDLHTVPTTTPVGTRARLVELVADLTPMLGFAPDLHFHGVLDHVLPDQVTDDLLAVLRETLTNAARHAGARHVTVTVTHADLRLTLDVTDDGVGLGPSTRRSGLANLRRRAERLGGTLTLSDRHPHGTQLTWTIGTSVSRVVGAPG